MPDRKIPVVITEEMVQRQVDIENESMTRAIARSRNAVKEALESGRASELPAVSRLIAAAFGTVSTEIERIKAEKVAGRGGKFRGFLRKLPTDLLATSALITCLDRVASLKSTQMTYQSIASQLGRQVQAEILRKNLTVVAPAYMNRVDEYLQQHRTKSPSHILRTYRASAEAVGLADEPWVNTQCISVGTLLLSAVYETGLFTWESGPNQLKYLNPAPELERVLTDVMQNAHAMVTHPPMIIPPVPHTTMWDGGYVTDLNLHRPTYKNKSITNAERRRVASAFEKAEGLKQALNTAQSVPYRINHTVLDTVLAARAQGLGIGMPSTHATPKPEWYLTGIPKEKYSEKELEEFEEWKLQARNWYGAERIRISKLRAFAISLQQATEYKEEPALYFPTCVDWRYRIYFKSALNPQGSDLQKALIEFGHGKALGERGLFWLKVHVATTFGYDKKLPQLRAEWVDLHWEQILNVVNNPLNSQEILDADSPWCFYAACIDLVAAVQSGNPSTYVSRIPVAMDATNSGGQHFSAMLRDPIGGALTNLFWTGDDEKADMYMEVKRRTDIKVAQATDDVLQQHYWMVNPITRAMTKRPAMTYFYSATLRSCADYIMLGAMDEGYEATPEMTMTKYAAWLAPRMRDSIGDAMPSAATAMEFLQDVSRRVPLENHLEWLTPLGGLVLNRYATVNEMRIHIHSMGINQVVGYNKDYQFNNRRKATAGVAPNAVHSQDATHLGMLINAADCAILPIHDSVATHASDVDAMHTTIRREFIRLYTEQDFLEVIKGAAVKAGADVSDLVTPSKGDLDLESIAHSPFFFC